MLMMRNFFLFTLYWALCSPLALASDIAKENDQIQNDLSEFQFYIDQVEFKREQIDNLKISKAYIISGDTIKAKYFLGKIQNPSKKLENIIRYYYALISFIESNF